MNHATGFVTPKRKRINHIKDHYRSGLAYANADVIADDLSQTFGDLYTIREASDYDRASRKELVAQGVHVTPPIITTGYERDPSASYKKREDVHYFRMKGLLTQMEGMYALALCAALQPDASPTEIRYAAKFEMSMHNLRETVRMLAPS